MPHIEVRRPWHFLSCITPHQPALSRRSCFCAQVLPDGTALAEWLCTKIAECISCAVAERGACSLGFSGGSLLSLLAPLAERKDLKWDSVHAFLIDERVVPHRRASFGAETPSSDC